MDLAQRTETIMRRKFLIAMPLALVSIAASAQNLEPSPRNTMKIRFVLNGTPVSATLEDNATSRDFLAVLPLKVKLERLRGDREDCLAEGYQAMDERRAIKTLLMP